MKFLKTTIALTCLFVSQLLLAQFASHEKVIVGQFTLEKNDKGDYYVPASQSKMLSWMSNGKVNSLISSNGLDRVSGIGFLIDAVPNKIPIGNVVLVPKAKLGVFIETKDGQSKSLTEGLKEHLVKQMKELNSNSDTHQADMSKIMDYMKLTIGELDKIDFSSAEPLNITIEPSSQMIFIFLDHQHVVAIRLDADLFKAPESLI
jgi:hypothetical protein